MDMLMSESQPDQINLNMAQSNALEHHPDINPNKTTYQIVITPMVQPSSSQQEEQPNLETNSKCTMFENAWKRLDACPVLNNQQIRGGKSQASREVQKICKMGFSEQLAEKVILKITSQIETMLQTINQINQSESKDDIDMEENNEKSYLISFKDFWISLCTLMQTYRDVFLYLERITLKNRSFWQCALQIVQNKLTDSTKDKLVHGVLNLIAADRKKELGSESRALIAKLIHVMLALEFYDKFEQDLLVQTAEFYKSNAFENFQTLNLPSYLLFVELVFRKEMERAAECLDQKSQAPLIGILEQSLIKNVLLDESISEDPQAKRDSIKSEFALLITEQRVEDLVRLASQIKRVEPNLASLQKLWIDHLYDKGYDMLNDEQLAKKSFRAIEDFIQFKAKSDDLVARVFPKEQNSGSVAVASEQQTLSTTERSVVNKIVRSAFEKFLNIDPNIVAEYLAKYLDYHLKKTQQDEDTMAQITVETIGLFKLCRAKDIFEEFYMRGLSRRLLLKKASSNDSEKAMLTKLRAECGSEFTTKAEAMLKDLQESDIFAVEYKKVRPDLQNDAIDSQVSVLSRGSWPIAQLASTPQLSPELQTIQTNFETYYKKRYQGKCLSFATHMATCLLVGTFSEKSVKFIEVSGLQAIVLMAFNTDKDQLTYQELEDITGLKDRELNVQIISLATMEYKVLKIIPQADKEDKAEEGNTEGKPELSKKKSQLSEAKASFKRQISKTDCFAVNRAFKCPLKRIAINQIQKKESKGESDEVYTRVLADRKFNIDAAIVKTMKTRKKCTHQDIVKETIGLVRFPLEVSQINARIDNLINNGYIELADSQADKYAPQTVYNYLP